MPVGGFSGCQCLLSVGLLCGQLCLLRGTFMESMEVVGNG